MQTVISSQTTVTTSYQGRLLCPPRHLFDEAHAHPAFPSQPIDSYQPTFPGRPPVQIPALPPGEKPFDGIPPNQVRVGNVGELLIGGIVGHTHHQAFADAIDKLRSNGLNLTDLKGLGQASLKAGGLSAGITAAVSAVQNISAAASGKISVKEATSNVTSDTVGGMLSGSTAGIGAGAATLALRSMGAGGIVLSIGAAAAGAVGGIAGSKLYEASGLRERVFNAAKAFLS